VRVAVVGAGPAGLYAAEALPNSHPAISFVGWYNGHPDYRDLPVDLTAERAVVVGNGNVRGLTPRHSCDHMVT
jgi:NADPH-dependent glutamate synthase beta subunit-like oxidoreductase